MQLSNYPIISGPLRIPLLFMEWFIVAVCLEAGLIFLMRYFQTKKKAIKNTQELSYASLFFSYGILWIWYILSDFYAPNIQIRYILLNLGYFTQLLGFFLFIINMERISIFYKKYFFTILYSICILIFFITLFISIRLTQLVSYFLWPIFVVFLFLKTKEISQNSSINKNYLIIFFKFIIGYIFISIGYWLTTDLAISIFGLNIRIIGDLIQVIVSIFLFIFYLQMPPVSEFDWSSKINDIYLIHKNGLCFYNKTFKQRDTYTNEHLVSGMMSGLGSLLDSMLDQKDGASVIKTKDRIVITYPTDHLTAVLFCKDELNIIKALLKSFARKIESIYGNVLEIWTGDLNIFDPIEEMCNEHFKSGK